MSRPFHRDLTRMERYESKRAQAKHYPFSFVTCNFDHDSNLAFLARALACFGGDTLHIIGKLPNPNDFKRYSGGLSQLINVEQYSTPQEFINYWKKQNNSLLLAAELTNDSVFLHDYKFPKDQNIILALGNEQSGIPVEIMCNVSATISIPMEGIGFCLNVSQTGNVFLYEYTKQMKS